MYSFDKLRYYSSLSLDEFKGIFNEEVSLDIKKYSDSLTSNNESFEFVGVDSYYDVARELHGKLIYFSKYYGNAIIHANDCISRGLLQEAFDHLDSLDLPPFFSQQRNSYAISLKKRIDGDI